MHENLKEMLSECETFLLGIYDKETCAMLNVIQIYIVYSSCLESHIKNPHFLDLDKN
jgi:hypothetical protein